MTAASRKIEGGELEREGEAPAESRFRVRRGSAGASPSRFHHLVSFSGRRAVQLPFRYSRADDKAEPNHTGQPAVDILLHAHL